MELYVARQPIFNSNLKIVAYELLYRTGINEKAGIISNGDLATLTVINNAALALDVRKLTDGKRAFINFTKNTIINMIPTIFPPDTIVIELLEDIQPDKEFLKACEDLKNQNYPIALDDFSNDTKLRLLVDIASIIKVDFLKTTPEDRKNIVMKYSKYNVKFLAEKVESMDQFKEAIQNGYDLFQGYFFAKPVVVKGKDVSTFYESHLRLLAEISSPDPDFGILSSIVESDVSMTYKLMKLVNSTAYSGIDKIKNVHQALTRIGQDEIKKWVVILMIHEISNKKPDVILRTSLVRAKISESICESFKISRKKDEVFLAGLFSLIDIIMDKPMEDVLDELPLSTDIKDSLMGKDNQISRILKVIYLYEKAEWSQFEKYAEALGISGSKFYGEYLKSIEWVNDIFGEGFKEEILKNPPKI